MPSKKILICIFLSSLSALAFEVTLTRIFSISLSYHFAFMVVSIAMLGIGISGTLLTIFPNFKRLSNLGVYGLFLGISISLCYALSNQIPFDPVRLSWERIQFLYIGFYYIILSLPFFFTGLIVGTAFSELSGHSGLLYGSDLCGAGIGSMATLFLMYVMPPEKIVFALSIIALSGAAVIGSRKVKAVSAILIVINLLLAIQSPEFTQPRISQYKGLQIALRYPGAEHINTYYSPFSRVDIFRSPAVRFAPGLSLRYLDPLPEQIGISVDGGDVNAITSTGDKKTLRFLGYLPSALLYEITKRRNDVLIVEPAAGLHALLAEYYGSKEVVKVESNPLLIEIIRNRLRKFSDGIYDINTFEGLGRTWLLTRSNRLFDIIDIPMTGAMPSGSFGIAEDYRFTIEAFGEYIRHLKPDGFLSINLFIIPPPRTELRLLNTIVSAIEGIGIKDAAGHIAAIRSWGTITILVKKTKLSSGDIEKIKEFSKERRFDLIYYPGIKEGETNIYVKMIGNEYPNAFKNILNPVTRKQFDDNYIFDIKPVYDMKPFFNYYLRLKNIKPIYEVMGKKWQYFMEEGYLLIGVFIQVLLLSAVIILIPIPSLLKVKLKLSFLPYFAFLGIGFMFIEISLIQDMILPFGNPPYAVASVLTSLLISSAIGSLLSHRFSQLRSAYAALVIAISAVSLSFLLHPVLNIISTQPLYFKIAAAFLTVLPLGIFMGIPFPLGLKILGEKDPYLIPWAWAINGCFSVLAPILTIILAVEIGFKAMLWLGGGTYIAAFGFLKFYTGRKL